MNQDSSGVIDTLTLRFTGEDKDGVPIHELRAAHVAEVLQGVVGLTNDFAKAGAFHEEVVQAEILVRPPSEGSFVIEVIRWVEEYPTTTNLVGQGAVGMATLIMLATKSARADVEDYEYLDNGNVKINWQDNTVDEVPKAAWDELSKRKRRRKRHLRQIMAPLSDKQVEGLQVMDAKFEEVEDEGSADVKTFSLDREDYDAVRPESEVEETAETFEAEAQMSAVNFDDRDKWRIKVPGSRARNATITDEKFLGRLALGLAIRKSDIFRLRVREDRIKKNGRTRTTWTVLEVLSHKRGSSDDDDSVPAAE